jgi:hypothetical protein
MSGVTGASGAVVGSVAALRMWPNVNGFFVRSVE